MANLFKFRDLFRPSMYMAADHYRDSGHGPVEWDVVVVHEPEDGVMLEVTHVSSGRTARSLIRDDDITKAVWASLEWRYRLFGGLKMWRVRPLWLWRDRYALVKLFQHHAKLVFDPTVR